MQPSRNTLAAFALAGALWCPSVAFAQLPTDYDFQWAPLADLGQVAIPSNLMFSVPGGPPGTVASVTGMAGVGDLIRKCYSVDVTQGGKNQSDGQYESSWYSFTQGFDGNNTVPGVDVGAIAVHSATDSDLFGDACLSPWFSSIGNTGGYNTSVTIVPGVMPGTAGGAFPVMWHSVFQWVGATGVTGPNQIGLQTGNGNPLLANVIYDVHGPSSPGPANVQYYSGTMNEKVGTGAASMIPGRGTGGVTNGNSNWGFNVFGVTADLSGAISHTRILTTDTSGVLSAYAPFWGTSPGSAEVNNYLAFATPFLWAENDGSIGSGGPDWRISSLPVSNVQLYLKDIRSGAQSTSDVLWKTGGGGAPSAIYDPNLILNVSLFFWSSTPAVSMQQLPMSWCDLGGVPPASPGSLLLGSMLTSREGAQTVPICFDPLTSLMLGNSAMSLGTSFSGAGSPFFDAGPPGAQALYEGMYDPVVSGISKLSQAGGSPFPVAPNPIPSLAGVNIGVAAVGLQVTLNGSSILTELTEFANGLTITLQ